MPGIANPLGVFNPRIWREAGAIFKKK